MKIRTGFVSNSSSSSFIILFEREVLDHFSDFCPHCNRGGSDFYFESNEFNSANPYCDGDGDNRYKKLSVSEYIAELNKNLKCRIENSYSVEKKYTWIYDEIDRLQKEIKFFASLTPNKYYLIDLTISYSDSGSLNKLKYIKQIYCNKIRILYSEDKFETDEEYKNLVDGD